MIIRQTEFDSTSGMGWICPYCHVFVPTDSVHTCLSPDLHMTETDRLDIIINKLIVIEAKLNCLQHTIDSKGRVVKSVR